MPLWATRAELDTSLTHWHGPPADSLRVIEEAGEVAAFGGIQVGGVVAVVGPLVAPRFRGQKMGSQLLEASIELAGATGAEWLIAAVGPRNVGGRLLLERRGFRSRGGVDAVYRLLPGDHRPAGPAPRSARPGRRRRRSRPDLDALPAVLPDRAAQRGRVAALARRAGGAGRRARRRDGRVPAHRAGRGLDHPCRRGRGGARSRRRRLPVLDRGRGLVAGAPGERAAPLDQAGQHARDPRLPQARLRPWLVLQTFELRLGTP